MEKWIKDKNNQLRQRAHDLRDRIESIAPQQVSDWGLLDVAVEASNIAHEYEMLLKCLDDSTRKR